VKRLAVLGATLLASAALAGAPDVSRVNGSISIDPHEEAGDVSTVNGSIKVGDHATVNDVSTVNGQIEIGTEVHAKSVSTVNGDLDVGAHTHLSGSASTINGGLLLETAAEVGGGLSSVNGKIRLEAAHVGSGIKTVSGDIEIGKDSHVEGGVLVQKNKYSWFSAPSRAPVIVVGPGASVSGTLRFELPVKLYVSDRATIGPVEGATVTTFSGDRP
jgi:predicted acyltransferase (DUF342 family)